MLLQNQPRKPVVGWSLGQGNTTVDHRPEEDCNTDPKHHSWGFQIHRRGRRMRKNVGGSSPINGIGGNSTCACAAQHINKATATMPNCLTDTRETIRLDMNTPPPQRYQALVWLLSTRASKPNLSLIGHFLHMHAKYRASYGRFRSTQFTRRLQCNPVDSRRR